MNTIVSFNIIRKVVKPDGTVVDKLLNNDNFPIIFESNKDTTFVEELKENVELWGVLNNKNTFTYINYCNTSIQGIRYCSDTNEYSEEVIQIQDLFPLESFEDGRNIAIKLIEYYLKKLYTNSGGVESLYVPNDTNANILMIYNHIKNTFPNNFNDNIIIDFVEDKLTALSKFNEANIKYSIYIFKKMLNVD